LTCSERSVGGRASIDRNRLVMISRSWLSSVRRGYETAAFAHALRLGKFYAEDCAFLPSNEQ
jgi:hypothetical protein